MKTIVHHKLAYKYESSINLYEPKVLSGMIPTKATILLDGINQQQTVQLSKMLSLRSKGIKKGYNPLKCAKCTVPSKLKSKHLSKIQYSQAFDLIKPFSLRWINLNY